MNELKVMFPKGTQRTKAVVESSTLDWTLYHMHNIC